MKHSIIKSHVKSVKHTSHKHQFKEKRVRECDTTQAFKVYEQEVHPSGGSLPEAHKLCG